MHGNEPRPIVPARQFRYTAGVWVLAIVGLTTCLAVALRASRWADVSLRVSRWTYGVVFPLSLLYFPLQSGFRVRPVRCEWTFDFALAVYSLRNFQHIAMFAVFFLLTMAQLPNVRRAMAWSFGICLLMGFLVEIAEGATNVHHCRMRDLIPDMGGACLGALVIVSSRHIRPAVKPQA